MTAVVVLLAWAWRNRIEQQARTAQDAPEEDSQPPRWQEREEDPNEQQARTAQYVPEDGTPPPRRQAREDVPVTPASSARFNLEVYTVKQLQAWLRSRKLKVSGNKAELIARIHAFQAQTSCISVNHAAMEVSQVAPCPHSRTVSGANAHAAWKKCAECGKMRERTVKQAGAPTEYFVQ